MPKIIEASDVGFTSGASVGAFKGCVRNLNNKDYHGLKKYWSSSDLKFMNQTSPQHFHARYFGSQKSALRRETEAMVLGSLVHCFILTPNEFDKDFFTMPDLNLRTNAGKETRDQLVRENEGKTPVTEELIAQANAMREACLKNKFARELLEPGQKELGFFWTCPFSHLNFKAKVDSGGSSHFVELKTTSKADAESFSRHIDNMDYDLSIIHYRTGIKTVFDVEPPAYFIVIEQEPPHTVQVYKVNDAFLETGHAKWLSSITKLADGIQKQKWPGYFPEEMGIPEIGPPPWALNKLLKAEEVA